MILLLAILVVFTSFHPNVYGDHHDTDQVIESYDDDWLGPPSSLSSSAPSSTRNDPLEKILKVGDVIRVWGIYKSGTGKFSVNLNVGKTKEIALHVDFRPWSGSTVMNSLKRGIGWGTEIWTAIPKFQDGKTFNVVIECQRSQFVVSVDGVRLGKTFPYRIPLDQIDVVNCVDGYKYIKWTRIEVPEEPMPQDWSKALAHVKSQVEKSVTNRGFSSILSYLESDEGTIETFQWVLFDKITAQGKSLNLKDEVVWWLVHDRTALETIMTSGDVEKDRYKEAVDIIVKIIKQDSNAKSGLKLNLAVAIGLTFSTPVHSMAISKNTIDGIARYHNFAAWSDKRLFYEPFYKLNAWQMRYVVGSWAEDSELEWARANVYAAYRSPNKIADAGAAMVAYKLVNDDGISVHSGAAYYYHKPVTMAWIHKIGGVCGAISKFSAHMAQAHGIPAMPVGQPGHCAFIWLKNGQYWSLGYDISGWSASTTHSGIQWSWSIKSPFIAVMETAQREPRNYRLSEKLRLAAKFDLGPRKFTVLEHASTLCPENIDVWYDLSNALETAKKGTVEKALQDELVTMESNRKRAKNIGLGKAVSVSAEQGSKGKLNDGSSSEWIVKDPTAWFEIDLGAESDITQVKIQWWGQSRARSFDVLATDQNNHYTKVRTEKDQKLTSTFNGFSILSGWEMKTRKIKFNLRDGIKDPWGYNAYFGIRDVTVNGILGRPLSVISRDKPTEPATASQLVDGDMSRVWSSQNDPTNVAIDLKKLSLVDTVRFNWAGAIQGRQSVSCELGGSGNVTMATKEASYKEVSLDGAVGSKIGVKMKGSGQFQLKEIEVVGTSFGAKEVLKGKIEEKFEGTAQGKATVRGILTYNINRAQCSQDFC